MKYDYLRIEIVAGYLDDECIFRAEVEPDKPKFYALIEFPYCERSACRHARPYTALDIFA